MHGSPTTGGRAHVDSGSSFGRRVTSHEQIATRARKWSFGQAPEPAATWATVVQPGTRADCQLGNGRLTLAPRPRATSSQPRHPRAEAAGRQEAASKGYARGPRPPRGMVLGGVPEP